MNATRERLYGAITAMNHEQLERLWHHIDTQSKWDDIPLATPEEEAELADALKAMDEDPDCHEFVSRAEAERILSAA